MEKKSFNRRNFLKTGTLAGAASILLHQIVLAKKQGNAQFIACNPHTKQNHVTRN